MNVKELIAKLDLKTLSEGDTDLPVTGCYCGDLLSWVMSRAQEGDAWLTVMGNINAIGVAALTEAACIILVDNAALDDDALKKAQENDITVLQSEADAFSLAVWINRLLNPEE